MTSFELCERRNIHGSHTWTDHGGEYRCPGRTTARVGASSTPLRDRLLGALCPAGCGRRGDHDCQLVPALPAAADVQLVHGRLLDGTVLCPDASLDVDSPFTTVFLDIVTCELCSGRLARIQGRPTDQAADPRPVRPGRLLGGRKAGAA